ncbi:MAG: hypothetical protein ABIK95_07825 [Acidobacteriota bacterium]
MDQMFSMSGVILKKWGKIFGVLLASVVLTHCNFGIPDFTIIVRVEAGVEGTPQSGQYEYTELSKITYDYTPLNPSHAVEVYVNATRHAASGTLTVFNSYTITAQLVDLRGTWSVSMLKTGSSTADFEFTITISGPDVMGGTFSDSRGYNGIWTAADDVVTFTYTDWIDYVLTGDHSNMSGSFQGEGNSGSWSAKKTT